MKMHKQKADQTGIVSIFVVMVIMIVLSLLVINFARLVRRNERQALDNVLSTQALYAAESGVNDAVAAIKANPSLLNTDRTTLCNGATSFIGAAGLNNIIDSSTSYPCMFVTGAPALLNFSDLSTSNSKLFPVTRKDGANITQINFSWETPVTAPATNSANDCPTNIGTDQNPKIWQVPPKVCTSGPIRIDIVPSSASNTDSINRTFTAFIYPSKNSPSAVTFASGTGWDTNQGTVALASCPSIRPAGQTKFCGTYITFAVAEQAPTFYVRVRAVYKNAQLSVCVPTPPATATDCTGSTPLIGAQAMIDVTGKANDVLRRIQVYVPVIYNPIIPEFGLQTTDGVCKRYVFSAPNLPVLDETGIARDLDTDGSCGIE